LSYLRTRLPLGVRSVRLLRLKKLPVVALAGRLRCMRVLNFVRTVSVLGLVLRRMVNVVSVARLLVLLLLVVVWRTLLLRTCLRARLTL
jgi:hypothetical protein